MLSVDDVAARLNLHPRTVRGYIRTGRLRAVRIGKQYRITERDFAALAARPAASAGSAETPSAQPTAEAGVVVQIAPLEESAAARLSSLLSAVAGQVGGHITVRQEPDRFRVTVLASAGLAEAAELLALIGRAVDDLR